MTNLNDLQREVFCKKHGKGKIIAVCSEGREVGMPLITFEDGVTRAGHCLGHASDSGMKECCDGWTFLKGEEG